MAARMAEALPSFISACFFLQALLIVAVETPDSRASVTCLIPVDLTKSYISEMIFVMTVYYINEITISIVFDEVLS